MREIIRLFAILVFALGFTAPAAVRAADACHRAFATDPFHFSPEITTPTAWGPAFDPAAFKVAWRDLQKLASGNREISVRPYRDQLSPRASLLRVDMHLRGPSAARPLRILITAGIHGNEPLGVQTALDLIHSLIDEPHQTSMEIVFLPALNFDGLVHSRRKAVDETDLNRQFADASPSEAIARIQSEIGTRPFDVSLDLHGAAHRTGFFVIKSGDDHGVAENVLNGIDDSLLLRADDGGPTGPVGLKTDHGVEKRYDLEAPGLATSVNVGTMKGYMASLGTPFAYTIEYPGEIPASLARETNLRLVKRMLGEASRALARHSVTTGAH